MEEDLENRNKRSNSPQGDGSADGSHVKKQKFCHEGESDVTIITERRQTMLEKTAEWKRNHPTCFPKRFISFYSPYSALCYNPENGFLAQAKLACFTYIDGEIQIYLPPLLMRES